MVPRLVLEAESLKLLTLFFDRLEWHVPFVVVWKLSTHVYALGLNGSLLSQPRILSQDDGITAHCGGFEYQLFHEIV